jgi:hypothetical protein
MRLRRSLRGVLRSAHHRISPRGPLSHEASEITEIRALQAVLSDPVVGAEARALCSPGSRREARDRHAMSVLLAATLSRGAHTIDVGAHSGAVLREIVRIAPVGRHIAYEPIPQLAAQLAEEFPP